MKRNTALLIVITAIFSAFVTYMLARESGPVPGHEAHPAAEAEEQHSDAGSVEISGLRVEPAIAGESWDVIAATGKVVANANKVVKIGPRIEGKITRVYANVGDTVQPGQVLAALSSMELAQARAAHRQASARVNATREAYDRQVKLANLGAFSKRPVEEARAEYASAQGDLAQAKGELAQNKGELSRAESELAQCAARLDRAKELYKDQIISRQDIEAAEAEHKRDSADIETVTARIRQTEAKIQQAEARVGIAKTYLSREEKVLGGNLLASKELQAAKAERNSAEIEFRAAADAIRVLGASPAGSGDTVGITSPIAGRVVSRAVSLGEVVDPSATLFVVMNLSDVSVEADVYEKDLAKIRKGQAAETRVNSYPDRVFAGKVTYVSEVLDPESRTAKVRCGVPNASGLLKPEMFANVTIITARRGGAVLIPREAVLDEAGKKVVFTPCRDCEEDTKAGRSVCGSYDKREVEVGPAHDGRVEVPRGVKPGEEVVIVGAYQLKTALSSGKLEAGCTDE
jgi:cobalt-zinc-cadmium efflux system membrane fusion protein